MIHRLGPYAVMLSIVLSADAIGEQWCGYAGLGEFSLGREFDPANGRDIRNFPPDPQVDFTHIRLDLTFDDLMDRSFTGTETISFRVLARPVARLDLNGIDLGVNSVKDGNGNELSFRYDDETLTVRFPADLAPGSTHHVVIDYACRDPKFGMIFALPDEAYADRPLAIHTQGEPELNRYWFFCHDFPNERSTTEIIATVPGKYIVVSNGELIERKALSDDRTRWHFRQDQPHVPYLVSLVIGEFAIVRDEWRGKPVEYYVPPHREDDARRTFGKTPKMIEAFSRLIGVDYPYAKYAQAVCYEFGSGAMENTSTSTFHEDVMLDERAAVCWHEEMIVAHELAHQWFGDMVTCKSWAHIWLNEGFATFMDHVWDEVERGRDEYEYRLFETANSVAEKADIEARHGMIFPIYEYPGEVFWKPESNSYRKGAAVLHMLRCELGDELFWRCARTYLERFAWQSAETDDFRKVIEELTGRSCERFFHQWVYRPGVPQIKVGYEWDEDSSTAKLTFEQTQKLTADSPAFVADIEVWLVDADGRIDKRSTKMTQRFAGLTAPCPREPKLVCVNPRHALLADWEFAVPKPMRIEQALHGPTATARLQAIDSLAEEDDDKARDALQTILMDEKAHWGIRATAASALGRMQQSEARDILLAALAENRTIAHHRVRRAAASALSHYREAKVVPTLIRLATTDGTNSVEGDASRALGSQDPTDAIVEALLANSQRPELSPWARQNVIAALADCEDPRGIDPAMETARYGSPYRLRSAGIKALGKLGAVSDETRERVRPFLESLLSDRQHRAVDTAIGALAEIGDKKAIPALQDFANSSAPEYQRNHAREAIDQINRENGEREVIRDLRERIQKLDKAREEIEKKLSTERDEKKE